MLPWGPHKGPVMQPPDSDLRPGEFVMRLLFTEFTVQAERKMEAVMAEAQVFCALRLLSLLSIKKPLFHINTVFFYVLRFMLLYNNCELL